MRSYIRPAATLLVFLFGCSSPPSRATDPALEVATHQQRWETSRTDDYRYDFEQQCFCVREQVQPVTIEVRDGRISRVISRETGQEVPVTDGLRWHTVADLFRLVTEAQQDGGSPPVVRYDPQLGYPTYIEIGTLANDAGVIYSASNLERLP